jgi:hypothetical protein
LRRSRIGALLVRGRTKGTIPQRWGDEAIDNEQVGRGIRSDGMVLTMSTSMVIVGYLIREPVEAGHLKASKEESTPSPGSSDDWLRPIELSNYNY